MVTAPPSIALKPFEVVTMILVVTGFILRLRPFATHLLRTRPMQQFEDSAVETTLLRWVTAGVCSAVLVTGLMGFLSWRTANKAAEEADWVAHTYAVKAALEDTLRHVVDVQTSARTFSSTGEEAFLGPYFKGEPAIAQELDLLRHLTADNREQQMRLDSLEPQIAAKFGISKEMVAARRETAAVAPTAMFLESQRRMDAVRATVAEMQAGENKFLEQRTEKTATTQRLTKIITFSSTLMGVFLLLVFGLAIRREINKSARMRGELRVLNADLEQRVEQRTAALEIEVSERGKTLKELADQKFALDQHAIVAITDVKGTITYVNDKFCSISKYSKDELIGQNHRILNSSHHSKEFFQQMYHTIANGKVWHGEIKNQAKDGSIYWVDTTIVPSVGAEGKPRQYVAIRADITERKRAEDAVKESLASSKTALKELADQKFALDQHAIVAITDVQGTITYVNNKFCAISQYSKDELIGQNHRILNSSHHPKEFFQQMYHTIANGEVWHGEIKNRAKDGSIYWVDTTIVPTLSSDGKPRQYVAIRADITERKLAGAEIRKLNDELEHRVIERTAQLEEVNKELESFTYSVAHDLRAPLRHIVGFSGILVEEFGASLSVEAQRYLQRIQDGTRKMGQLVDELLSLARVGRQEANLQQVGLNSIVKEVIGILQPELAGRQVEWRIADLPFVECDPTLLKQVFQNLISNSLKYSRPRPLAVIEIGHTQHNGDSVIFVRDNGVGFNMKYADKLFGVFQRLHRAEDFEGTGVGLATVQRIIKKHQGKVWAEAQLDKGATFYFTLGGTQTAETKTETLAMGV
jgi:PAS domain S-box-containing protein